MTKNVYQTKCTSKKLCNNITREDLRSKILIIFRFAKLIKCPTQTLELFFAEESSSNVLSYIKKHPLYKNKMPAAYIHVYYVKMLSSTIVLFSCGSEAN